MDKIDKDKIEKIIKDRKEAHKSISIFHWYGTKYIYRW